MTTEANKALVRRFIAEIFAQGQSSALDELVADDFVAHTWGPEDSGKEDLRRAVDRVSLALTDRVFSIEDIVAEADRVAVRLTASARQVGEFMGLPPSGRSYRIGEMHLFVVRAGRIAEHWHYFDQLGLMRQLAPSDRPGGG